MPKVISKNIYRKIVAGAAGMHKKDRKIGSGRFGRIHRLLRLTTMLQSGRGFGASELANRLGTSRRTVFRYLDILRAVGMEFEHDPQANGYRAKPGSLLRPVDLNLSEALALLLASRGVKRTSEEPSVPLLQAAGSAALKIESVLPPAVQRYCRSLIDNIVIYPSPAARHDHSSGFFQELQKAIQQKRKLKMVYRSFAEEERIETILSPYKLLFCQRAWYVLGYSSLHKAVRTFKVLRIYTLKPLDKLYVEDENFDLEKYFGDAWSMIPEGRLYSVVLRFGRKVAGNVAEVLWHKSQRIEWLKDGAMIFRVTVDGLNEISWWILGYGAQVEVMGPKALRNRLARTAAQMAELYHRKRKQCV